MNYRARLAASMFLFAISALAVAEESPPIAEDEAFIGGCIAGVLEPARRDYYARAKQAGNPNPKPFPEQQVRASVEPLCVCVAGKLAEKGVLPGAVAANSPEAARIAEHAISSGECKMGGKLGETISRKMQAPKN